MSGPRELPSGTVTFLFTDIEGSTRLLQSLGDERFRTCLETHDRIIRECVEDGVVVRTIGDAFFVVFREAAAAVASAVRAQRRLAETVWPPGGEMRVRMGLHTGAGVLGGGDYVGLDVHRAARISDAGHGGQILISEAAAAGVDAHLPDGVEIRDLGSYRLKDLSEPQRLYQVSVEGLDMEFPALRSTDAVEGNLPIRLTSFVGRERELAEVAELLEAHRLVTLTGPGGTGKTRLSLEAASDAVQDFPHGVFFVPLESITDPDLVPAAVLEALGMRSTSSLPPSERLENYLESKTVLLVLDNLEQILPVGRFVAGLLDAAPRLKVLATSRAPLRVSGEQEYRVPPLPTAPEEAGGHVAGVELFEERARAANPDFHITDENAATVSRLVSRLDGLPLAIELAASRSRHLTPESMLDRLDNRLLATRAPDLPARQQTMTNAIAWSYELLDESARRLLERCAVFVGGAGLSDIETVCGGPETSDILDDLADLVDHSLMVMGSEGGESRYRMLVVVREFALDALTRSGSAAEIRKRHARRYAELASEATAHLLTTRQGAWLDRLSVEHDNVRAALEWTEQNGAGDLAQGMVGDLWRFWQARGHLDEAAGRIDRALALPGDEPLARARALEAKGGVAYWQGDWEGALVPYEEALELLRTHGDPAELANALYNAAFPVGFSGDRERARGYLRESLAIAEEAGDRLGVGRAYWGLCDMAMYEADHRETIRLSELSVREFEGLDAPFDLGWAHFMIAQAHFYLGNLESAREHIDLGLPLFAGARDVSAMVLFLYLKAAVSADLGAVSSAARMLGAVDALKQRSGAGIADVAVNLYDPVVRLASDESPDVRAEIEAGRRMSDEEALAFAASV